MSYNPHHQTTTTGTGRTTLPQRKTAPATYVIVPSPNYAQDGLLGLCWTWRGSDNPTESYLCRESATAPFRLTWSSQNAMTSPTPSSLKWDIILPLDINSVTGSTYPLMCYSETENREVTNADLPATSLNIGSDIMDGRPTSLTVSANDRGLPAAFYDLQHIAFEVFDLLSDDPQLEGRPLFKQVWLNPKTKQQVLNDGTRVGKGEVTIWQHSLPQSLV